MASPAPSEPPCFPRASRTRGVFTRGLSHVWPSGQYMQVEVALGPTSGTGSSARASSSRRSPWPDSSYLHLLTEEVGCPACRSPCDSGFQVWRRCPGLLCVDLGVGLLRAPEMGGLSGVAPRDRVCLLEPLAHMLPLPVSGLVCAGHSPGRVERLPGCPPGRGWTLGAATRLPQGLSVARRGQSYPPGPAPVKH